MKQVLSNFAYGALLSRGIMQAFKSYRHPAFVIMLRLHLQKLGSILGLLAILMTTFAPTISQALTANQRVDALLGAYCSAGNPTGTQHDDTSSGKAPGHLQACGYCHFFSHAPAVPTADAGFAPATWYDTPHERLSEPAPRLSQAVSAARPRAPPHLS